MLRKARIDIPGLLQQDRRISFYGMVPDLEALDRYAWSGHAVLMGRNDLPGQVDDKVLLLFGNRLSASRRKYRQFVADGISQGRRPELEGGGLRRSRKGRAEQDDNDSFDDRVLGGGDFVDRLRQEADVRHPGEQ